MILMQPGSYIKQSKEKNKGFNLVYHYSPISLDDIAVSIKRQPTIGAYP